MANQYYPAPDILGRTGIA